MAANNAEIFQFFMSCFSLVIIRFRVSVDIYGRIFKSSLVKGQRAVVTVTLSIGFFRILTILGKNLLLLNTTVMTIQFWSNEKNN